jgi:hypothetical protein
MTIPKLVPTRFVKRDVRIKLPSQKADGRHPAFRHKDRNDLVKYGRKPGKSALFQAQGMTQP